MANRSNTYLWTTLRPCFTSLYLAFLLHLFTNTVSGVSPAPYIPVDNIILNCGSSSNSTATDGRIWIGDDNSKFFPQSVSQNQASLATNPVQKSQSPLASQIPYTTARLSVSAFTYIFPVTTGQKFIRLYFYPASYSNFDRSRALFSVSAGTFTLLNNFNASLTADADADPGDTILREFCVNVKEDERLNLTFTPSNSNSFAFINGIEIVSMPSNLYYTPSDSQGFPYLSQQNQYVIGNGTALEALYRINVGGISISPNEDTGLFRRWEPDVEYMIPRESALPQNMSFELIFTKISPYTAPEDVYRTARTMGTDKAFNQNNNLTWEFSVDSQFDYLVRLHFCEIRPDIIDLHDQVFYIFVANQTAEEAADVMAWSDGRKGVPVYKDYAVSMFGKESQKKMNLSITLQANPEDWKTFFNDASLNGIEIFKVSDLNGNLAGPNPDPLPLTPQTTVPQRQSTKLKKKRTTIPLVGGGVSSFIIVSILGFFIFRQAKRDKDSSNSKKSCESTLPPSWCRYFSLVEIKEATNNFDNVFIIGAGGFGNVYKGYINGGATPVAIKRLKPGSQQGAQEFKSEIVMLSQLRHLHLVSLIGYCKDRDEMILVYDYMAHGTLRDHIYNTNNPLLCWKQRLKICIGAAQGLNYLHTGAIHTIIHRDMKTTNILLDGQWLAKVSDFGLSKFGPTMSKSHVSTMVKGTFGYLDPEYYRFQQLTEKSDVYAFGVVLCEVLCGKPAIVRAIEEEPISLAAWVLKYYHNGELDKVVDPILKREITPKCLKKFGEIAMNCLLDNGTKRPSMNDVVWSLEFALELQESEENDDMLDVAETDMKDNDELPLFPTSDVNESNDRIFNCSGELSRTNSNSQVTVVSQGSFASKNSDGFRWIHLPSSWCRYFSLVEIKEATNNFDNIFIIGAGGFGNVYKGYINGGATPVAIKRLKPGSQQGAQEFKSEIVMLSQLRHLHLVSLIGYCKDRDEMILVYDYMAHGTLRDHIYNTNNPLLCWKQRLKICIGAAQGLNYLHTGAIHTIIHRDMKTTNILLDEQWLAKVSDFGLSKFGPTMSKSHVSTMVKGTFGYLDPEYYRYQQLTEKSDVYAFGVVLCEVLCGKPAIVRSIEEEPISLAAWVLKYYHNGKLDKVVDPILKGEITPKCLKKFGEIAMNCLLDNGTKRPSMNDVVGGLEFALELQESEENDDMLDVAETDMKDNDELPLFPTSNVNESDDRIFNCSGELSRTNSNSQVTVESQGSFASKDSNGFISSRVVFSETMNPSGQ